jgi:shikimate dehydrogenase
MGEKGNQSKKKLFGLLGKDISYSFSKGYFSNKFEKEKLENHEYVNFDLQDFVDFPSTIDQVKEDLCGMNVTIPYKEDVFNYLGKVDKVARKIGAVNTIKITKKGNLKGYNTDVYGFENSIKPFLKQQHKRALILGTGGASKAVAYSLKKLGIKYKFVSRKPEKMKEISYSDLSKEVISKHCVIINCSPVGTSPNIEESPNIPYQFLSEKHLLFDLIYNPKETTFLSKGKEKGAAIKNGLEMLELQAEKSWEIWKR